MNAYPLMLANGYEAVGETSSLRAGPTGQEISSVLADKLEGRLCNVRYMAHAIDLFDGADSEAERNHEGMKQFVHLINTSFLEWTGYLYVAIRRAQRERRLLDVQRGLALLIALEQGIIEGETAVAMIAPDLVQMHDMRCDEGEKPLLDRQAEMLAIESRVQ